MNLCRTSRRAINLCSRVLWYAESDGLILKYAKLGVGEHPLD